MTSSNGNSFRATGHLCGGIHRSPVNSPHKGQWRGALMFSLIYAWINSWVNNREAGDLRRHPTHRDGIIMVLMINLYHVTFLVYFGNYDDNIHTWIDLNNYNLNKSADYVFTLVYKFGGSCSLVHRMTYKWLFKIISNLVRIIVYSHEQTQVWSNVVHNWPMIISTSSKIQIHSPISI